MARTQVNVRLPDSTIREIEQLTEQFGYESQSHVIITAVTRLHLQETQNMNTATFEHREMDGETVAVVTYPDGSMFTTSDWQSKQPQEETEIPDWQWVKVDPNDPADMDAWQPAIILNGFPRVIA